jgi:hypothetical protein
MSKTYRKDAKNDRWRKAKQQKSRKNSNPFKKRTEREDEEGHYPFPMGTILL